MKKRKVDKKKFNRALSRRGELTGKPGNFVLTSALVGLGATALSTTASAVAGSNNKKDDNQDREDLLREQGLEYQDQQQIAEAQYSQDVLSTYNPQGDAQMYARKGARMYEDGGFMDYVGGMVDKAQEYFSDDEEEEEEPPEIAGNNRNYNPLSSSFLKSYIGHVVPGMTGKNDDGGEISNGTFNDNQVEAMRSLLPVSIANSQYKKDGGISTNYADIMQAQGYMTPEEVQKFYKNNDQTGGANQFMTSTGTIDSFTTPYGNIGTTLGNYSYERDADGNIYAVDDYNYNSAPKNANNEGTKKRLARMKGAVDKMPEGMSAGQKAHYIAEQIPRSRSVSVNLGSAKDMGISDEDFNRIPLRKSASSSDKDKAPTKSTKNTSIVSPSGDSYEYKYNSNTGQYQTKKKSNKNWISIKKGSGAEDAISKLFPEEETETKETPEERQDEVVDPRSYTAQKWWNSYGGNTSAKNGAKIPYPYQDQNQTLGKINPTIFYQDGGKTTQVEAQGNIDIETMGKYKKGGVANKSMYDQLQGVSMQEYQQYKQGGEMPIEEGQMQGGNTQVDGGQLEQVSQRAQVVKGDNPELIDDVGIGDNPGEPNVVVDDEEVMVDAIDENGQPYKQIFSDTVLVPGKNVSMAKEAKKLLAQMPEDEESEQAQLLYKKLDDLFNIQQMLNGDSEGETAEEAAQGGMDPNAAMQMGEQMPPEQGGMPQQEGMPPEQGGQMQGAFRDGGMGYVGPSETRSPDGLSMSEKRRWGNLSHQRYQSGGAGYPSAGYQAGLQEQQMQAPYNYNPVVREQRPKSYILGGVGDWLGKGAGTKAGSNMDKIGAGISGAAQGIVPGYTAGYAMTPNNDGYSNTAMGLGALSIPAGKMANDFGTNYGIQQQANLDASAKQGNETNENITSSVDQASNAINNNAALDTFDQEMNVNQGYRTEPTEEEMYGGNAMNPQKFEDGGMMMMGEGPMGNTMMAGSIDEPMSMQDMYEKAKSFAEYYESTLKLPNTLSDMQASANPKGWGHMNESVSNRKHGHLMGRMHRSPQVDSTAVMSGSERGGPKPSKRKGYVMGGRLRYSMPLNKRSLTLTIL